MHWLSGLCNSLSKIAGIEKTNSTEKMISFLEEKEWDHMILYQDNKKKELFNEINPLGLTHRMQLPSEEQAECATYVAKTQNSLEVEDAQYLMVALAWVIPTNTEYFEKFPEVVFVDVIEDTNKDNRPLLTASGKDANGKMFTFLRAFLPNEQSLIFRWIFSVVFPN